MGNSNRTALDVYSAKMAATELVEGSFLSPEDANEFKAAVLTCGLDLTALDVFAGIVLAAIPAHDEPFTAQGEATYLDYSNDLAAVVEECVRS